MAQAPPLANAERRLEVIERISRYKEQKLKYEFDKLQKEISEENEKAERHKAEQARE